MGPDNVASTALFSILYGTPELRIAMIEPFEDIRWLSEDQPDAVSEVIVTLPDEVQDFVKDNCVILAMSGTYATSHMIRIPRRGKTFLPRNEIDREAWFEVRLLVFEESVRTEPEEHFRFIVAHEIAHAWLGHDLEPGIPRHLEKEMEADAQAAEWGFPRPASLPPRIPYPAP